MFEEALIFKKYLKTTQHKIQRKELMSCLTKYMEKNIITAKYYSTDLDSIKSVLEQEKYQHLFNETSEKCQEELDKTYILNLTIGIFIGVIALCVVLKFAIESCVK